MVDWLLRIVYEESLVTDIGRTCLMDIVLMVDKMQSCM